MTRSHLMALRLSLAAAEAVSAVLVFLAVSTFRFQLDPNSVWSVGIEIGPAAVIYAVIWVGAGWVLGVYRLRARWTLRAEAADVMRAAGLTLLVSLATLFLLHQDNVSRIFLGLLFATQPIFSILIRALLRSWSYRMRLRGRDLTYMIVAGTGQLAQDFADQLESHPDLGVHVLGHLTIPGIKSVGITRPTLGTIDDMSRIFSTSVIDEVAVCLPDDVKHLLEPLIAVAAGEGKTVRIPRDSEEGALSGALQEDFGRFLVHSVVYDGQRDLERAAKRLVDIVGALCALIVLGPLMAVAAALVLVRDGRPILFRQTRVGLHGREFTILKFRTMTVDAEERYREVAQMSDTAGAAFKMIHDPRCTPNGRFLRKWTLDELPQLLNVMIGDMSLVGPRPAPPREVNEYDIWHRRRLSVRPGMTGLWQVEARLDEHFNDSAALDLRYIDQWSLWMDLDILVKTLPAVLRPSGR